MIVDPILRRLSKIAFIDKVISAMRVYFAKEVCGVPMIEMLGMRICFYILLAVVIIRIIGED